MVRVCLLILASFLIVTGCQQQNHKNTTPKNDQTDPYVHVKDGSQKRNINNNTDIADHLAHIATSVPSVKSASAVVAGPYAVVGINVDKDLNRSRTGTVKYSVTEGLRHDPYGKTAVVVADADVAERLKQMNKQIRDGHAVQGVVGELSTIISRYMPEFPEHHTKPKQSDQNDKIIPENDRDKLHDAEHNETNEP